MKIAFIGVEKEDEPYIKTRHGNADIYYKLTQDEIVEKLQDIQILSIFILHKFDKDILSKLPNLKIILARSVWTDHIDLGYCKQNGIKVVHVIDYWAHVIAEHVYALLLTTVRRVIECDKRTWVCNFTYDSSLKWISLKWKTLWVLGTWKIWMQVVRIGWLWFQMNVLACDNYENKEAEKELGFKYASWIDEVLSKSDFISINIPLLPQTRHLIDKKAISKMKDGVIIINTARWAIVDTEALIEGLNSWKIAKACLDVIEDEDDPKKHRELLEHPNAIVSPHTAFYTKSAVKKQYDDTFRNIENFVAWEELENQLA